MIHRIAGAVVGAVIACAAVTAQAAQPQARVEHVKVHGPSLEGNLEGNSPDREVIVVLPPGYAASKTRRYPVIYFLHGFERTAQTFVDLTHAPDAVGDASARGADFIVVIPDTNTRQGGSMYSTSPTTGDFETFVARDLVAYVDSHYRTLAKRESRGLAGHSMGGYGVWRIGMKHPRLWSSLYVMSACCVEPRTETAEQAKRIAETPFDKAATSGRGVRAALASAVAWSPAPDRPPYYADFAYKDGAVDPKVLALWAANSPLAMVPQYLASLKGMTAIAVDVGDQDTLLKSDTAIHDELARFGVRHSFEVYPGDHLNRVAQRFDQQVLPFFARRLATK